MSYDSLTVDTQREIDGARYDGSLLRSPMILYYPEGEKPADDGGRKYFVSFIARTGPGEGEVRPVSEQPNIPANLMPVAGKKAVDKDLLGPLTLGEVSDLEHSVRAGSGRTDARRR
jgi:hypothetical protein